MVNFQWNFRNENFSLMSASSTMRHCRLYEDKEKHGRNALILRLFYGTLRVAPAIHLQVDDVR